MKRILLIAILGTVLVFFCILFLTDRPNKFSPNSRSVGLSINGDEITKINISTVPSVYNSIDITDKEQIGSIVSYLTSLSTVETKAEPGFGMSYIIKIRLNNDLERDIVLSGNKLLMELGKLTYEIPYKEANKFNTIFAGLLESKYIKNGEASVIGKVICIELEEDGRAISCIIKDKKNTKYNISLKNSKIIDSTESGWLILHEKDTIKVYYGHSNIEDDTPIIATVVFIQKVAQ